MLRGLLSALLMSPEGTLQKVSPGSRVLLCFPRDDVPTSSWTCLIPSQQAYLYFWFLVAFAIHVVFIKSNGCGVSCIHSGTEGGMVCGSPKPPCSSQAWLTHVAERGHAHLLFLARSASFLSPLCIRL